MDRPLALTSPKPRLLARFIPEAFSERLKLWTLFPPLLLVVTITLSFLRPCLWSFSLPCAAVGGWLVCVKWKTKGLWVSYGALGLLLIVCYRQLSLSDRLWQMGIVFSLALTYFTALLASEEIEAEIQEAEEEKKERLRRLGELDHTFNEAKEEWEQKQLTLQEEVEKWKELAEKRSLEKEGVVRSLALVEEQLGCFDDQKISLIAEADKARIELSQLKNSPPPQLTFDQEELRQRCAQAEGLYKQLRSQFEEKTRALAQTRRDLFHMQCELLAIEHQRSADELAPDHSDLDRLHDTLIALEKERTALEEEVSHLEELVGQLVSHSDVSIH